MFSPLFSFLLALLLIECLLYLGVGYTHQAIHRLREVLEGR